MQGRIESPGDARWAGDSGPHHDGKGSGVQSGTGSRRGMDPAFSNQRKAQAGRGELHDQCQMQPLVFGRSSADSARVDPIKSALASVADRASSRDPQSAMTSALLCSFTALMVSAR